MSSFERIVGAIFIIMGISEIVIGSAELLLGLTLAGGIFFGLGMVIWILGVTS